MEQQNQTVDYRNSNFSKREQLAIEAMKILLSNQGKVRRMTILSRFLFFIGLRNGWHAFYDYNFQDTAKKSYIIADEMIKAETE